MDNGKWIMEKGNNIIKNKSYSFAIRIVNLYKYLNENNNIYSLANQILRSGTAIGALMSEADHAQSKADFLSKANIALKEANETYYWLSLLHDTNYINDSQYQSLKVDCEELIKVLVTIVKTTKERLNK